MKTFSLPEKSAKMDFIFNMYGSMVMSFVSVLLLVIVSRISGESSAGIFSLVYSTAQMFYTVGVFEVRNIQVTDEKKEFTFSDCFAFRIITVGIMIACAIGFCFINSFGAYKTVAEALFCIYMALLAFSELFQGNMHKHGYLSVAGFSLGTSVILAAVAYVVSLIITKSLLISVIPMIAVMLLWVLFFDAPISAQLEKTRLCFKTKEIKKLFAYTTPLIISVFINQYSINCPKYAIDKYLTDIDQSHYGYLVMPAFCINLMSIFVFRPQILALSKRWASGEFKSFNKLSALLFGWVLAATVIVLAGGFILGIPALEWLYGADLMGYRGWLMVLLISGGFSAASSLACVIVAVARKQNYALIAYIASAVAALVLPNIMVKNMGFGGAPISYLIVNLVLFIGLFIVLAITVFSKGFSKQK